MNSFKVLMAALLLGAFTLSVTGCPGKKEEAPAATEESAVEETAPAATEETMDEATDEMPEDAEWSFCI